MVESILTYIDNAPSPDLARIEMAVIKRMGVLGRDGKEAMVSAMPEGDDFTDVLYEGITQIMDGLGEILDSVIQE